MFIEKFKKISRNSEWLYKEEKEILYNLYILDEENNKNFLVNNYQKILAKYSKENEWKFYMFSEFIDYLWKKSKFSDENIVLLVKNKLKNIVKDESFKEYSYLLRVLFSINPKDKEYYMEQYDLLGRKNSLYHDINSTFLEIFIRTKNNKYFIQSFEKNIVDNAKEAYFFSVKKWFEYLFSFKSNIFKEYFIELIEFFSIKENKQKLVHHHSYSSLVRSHNMEKFIELFKNFHEILDNAKFSSKEKQKIKDFLVSEVDFAFDNYERNIVDNFFINELFKYFYKKDNWFLIELLKWLNSKYVISWWDDLAVTYLTKEYVEDFISIYKDKKNSNLIYFTYDRLKNAWKIDIVKAFENWILSKEIKNRNKNLKERDKKFEKEKRKELEKEKEAFLLMTKTKKWEYYPKIFQDYSNYIRDSKRLKELFSSNEIKEINRSVIKQIKTLFRIIQIDDYRDEKISKILTYEKTLGNWYRHTRYSSYLSRIIDISKYIKFDLSKYYKSYVLFYPLLWWDERNKDILTIISKNLNQDDIDYILRVYSEDLHENAVELRYCHINNLSYFYEKFKDKFNYKQQKKLEKICLEVINWDEENNIYYKENFLKIYSEIWWEKKLVKLWNSWKKRFPDFNYFKDVLDSSIDNEERDKRKFLVFIVIELAKRYWHNKAIAWSLEQLKKWNIEAIDSHGITYPRTSYVFSWVSEKESELWHWWGRKYNFWYIFLSIPNVDILKEFLDILKFSFNILSDLESWKLKWNYEMYAYYLRRLFYDYIKNLDEKVIYKDYYYEVKNLLKKYNSSITYNFDLATIRKKCWIDDLEEDAKEIIEEKWIEEIKKLLEEKEKLQDKVIEYKLSSSVKYESFDKEFILFVEWKSDVIILENAWEKLRWSLDMPFKIENWYDCHHIWRWFKEENHWFLDSDPEKTFIWMLDYDSAYNKFSDLIKVNGWKNWEIKKDDDLKWKVVKHLTKKGFVFLLPVPIWRLIYAKTEYEDKSLLSIELLFEDKLLSWFVDEIEFPWWTKLLKMKDSKKVKFANQTKHFLKEDFVNFEAIFELIDNIISWKI